MLPAPKVEQIMRGVVVGAVATACSALLVIILLKLYQRVAKP